MSLQEPPALSAEASPLISDFSKGKYRALVFALSPDETEIGVVSALGLESTFSEFAALFTDQNIAWALVNLQYDTDVGAKRLKSLFVSWVPDSLSRPSFRETVRLKSNGVFWSGLIKKQMESLDCLYQANSADDLQLAGFLARASRFERDQVDSASLARYWPN